MQGMMNPNMPVPLPGDNPDEGITQQYSKEEVGYRPAPSADTSCARCVHFTAKAQQALGAGICDVVSGTIQPNGVCDLFAPAAGGMSSLIGPQA